MDNREKYMREAFDKMQQSKAGMANMTKDQLEAITQTIGALGRALIVALVPPNALPVGHFCDGVGSFINLD